MTVVLRNERLQIVPKFRTQHSMRLLPPLVLAISALVLMILPAKGSSASAELSCVGWIALDRTHQSRLNFFVQCPDAQKELEIVLEPMNRGGFAGSWLQGYSRTFRASGSGAIGMGHCRLGKQITCYGKSDGPALFSGWLKVDPVKRCDMFWKMLKVARRSNSGDYRQAHGSYLDTSRRSAGQGVLAFGASARGCAQKA